MPGRRRDARSAPAYPRTARVNEVLREVIADAIERMADSDERLRLVTVTAVETVAVLSRATDGPRKPDTGKAPAGDRRHLLQSAGQLAVIELGHVGKLEDGGPGGGPAIPGTYCLGR